jgi:hypothetical protein
MNIQIQDNFFSPTVFEKFQQLMLSHEFQWYYMDYKVTEDETEDDFQFTHAFYQWMQPQSGYWPQLPNELIEKLNIRLLINIKAKLTTRKHEQALSKFHVDQDLPNTLTSIFYVNSNNGCTVFKTGEKIESVENRMITFPSSYEHCTLSHTDTRRRVLLNINYIISP